MAIFKLAADVLVVHCRGWGDVLLKSSIDPHLVVNPGRFFRKLPDQG